MNYRGLRYGFIVVIFVFAPLFLGAMMFDSAPKTGRSTYSTSAYGHKAFYELLRSLNYKVRRFDRSLEKPPEQGGVFIALEPGKLLLRKQGAYAESLKEWISQGNTALITLDSDSDKLAENDDREEKKLEWVNAAQETMQKMRREKSRASSATSSVDKGSFRQSKQALLETPFEDDLGAWLKSPISIRRLHNQKFQEAKPVSTSTEGVNEYEIQLTRARVFDGRTSDSLFSIDDQTLVRQIRIGKGWIYLLSEPRLLQNQKIGEASHAVMAVRIIEKLAGHAQHPNIYFEEFSHGQSQAKTLGGLLTQGNMKWVLGHFFILAFIWVWFRAARVRAPRDPVHRSGSSRSEIIHSLARLYELSGDREALVQKLAEDNRRWLTSQLDDSQRGNVLEVLGERTGMSTENITKILTPPLGRSEKEFVEYASRTAELRGRLSKGV